MGRETQDGYGWLAAEVLILALRDCKKKAYRKEAEDFLRDRIRNEKWMEMADIGATGRSAISHFLQSLPQ